MKRLFCLFSSAIIFSVLQSNADDGYRLWLRYDHISDPVVLESYNKSISEWIIDGSSPTILVAAKELQTGLNGLLGKNIDRVSFVKKIALSLQEHLKTQVSVYFHRADSIGIGFNRTSTGSNAFSQYFPPVRDKYENIKTCPENLLLWFHYVPWDYKMSSGRTFWDELCLRYQTGVDSVKWLQNQWDLYKSEIDPDRLEMVKALLVKQVRDAKIWRDACILYFQAFSKRPIPPGVETPEHTLDYYKAYRYTDIPGTWF